MSECACVCTCVSVFVCVRACMRARARVCVCVCRERERERERGCSRFASRLVFYFILFVLNILTVVDTFKKHTLICYNGNGNKKVTHTHSPKKFNVVVVC